MKKVIIQLTGGLGNQLFQYAAGLSMVRSEPSWLGIEQQLGKPKGSLPCQAELLSFTLPDVPSVLFRPKNRTFNFVSRVTGYALRTGVKPSLLESKNFVSKAISSIATVVISLYFRSYRKLQTGKGVGYSVLYTEPTNTYLVGYFQSYRYAETVKNYMTQIKVEPVGPELQKLTSVASSEMPLIVHCRFGDYLSEKDFGIPSYKYYQNAISAIKQVREFRSIWVFSDDIELSKAKLNLNTDFPIRWINSVDDSVVSTLQAMRLGYGYVIANSSFSWWGAYLSRQASSVVFAPKPWFKNLEDPKDIIPPEWVQLEAGYERNH